MASNEPSIQEMGEVMRGPRIVEHKTQSDCKSDKDWPICVDDDWVSQQRTKCQWQTNHGVFHAKQPFPSL